MVHALRTVTHPSTEDADPKSPHLSRGVVWGARVVVERGISIGIPWGERILRIVGSIVDLCRESCLGACRCDGRVSRIMSESMDLAHHRLVVHLPAIKYIVHSLDASVIFNECEEDLSLESLS